MKLWIIALLFALTVVLASEDESTSDSSVSDTDSSSDESSSSDSEISDSDSESDSDSDEDEDDRRSRFLKARFRRKFAFRRRRFIRKRRAILSKRFSRRRRFIRKRRVRRVRVPRIFSRHARFPRIRIGRRRTLKIRRWKKFGRFLRLRRRSRRFRIRRKPFRRVIARKNKRLSRFGRRIARKRRRKIFRRRRRAYLHRRKPIRFSPRTIKRRRTLTLRHLPKSAAMRARYTKYRTVRHKYKVRSASQRIFKGFLKTYVKRLPEAKVLPKKVVSQFRRKIIKAVFKKKGAARKLVPPVPRMVNRRSTGFDVNEAAAIAELMKTKSATFAGLAKSGYKPICTKGEVKMLCKWKNKKNGIGKCRKCPDPSKKTLGRWVRRLKRKAIKKHKNRVRDEVDDFDYDIDAGFWRRVGRAFRRVGRGIKSGFKKFGRGLRRFGKAIKRGAQKAGAAIKRGAVKVGRAIKRGVVYVGKAIKKGMQKLWKWIKKAVAWFRRKLGGMKRKLGCKKKGFTVVKTDLCNTRKVGKNKYLLRPQNNNRPRNPKLKDEIGDEDMSGFLSWLFGWLCGW